MISTETWNSLCAAWAEVGTWARYHSTKIIVWLVVVYLAVLTIRMFWYEDAIGAFAIVTAVILWGVTGVAWGNADTYQKTLIFKRFRAAAWVVTCLSPMAFFLVGLTSGVWIDLKDGVTSIGRGFIVTTPFQNSVTWISDSFQVSPSAGIRTVDDIPLSCEVLASGIYLDDRRPDELETYLVATARTTNDIADYTQAGLQEAVTAAAVVALSGKSTREVLADNRLLIEYRIGTPVGDALRDLKLHWQNGQVSYNCSVVFNN